MVVKEKEDVLSGPHVSKMTVTPAMATDWLKRNTARNRKVVPGLVLKYAEDIRAKRWQLNGSTIVMADDGTIIDGQHRLLAIVQANAPVETMVASGIGLDAFETIDSGRRRTSNDVLSILGYTNVTELGALANMWLNWERSQLIDYPNGRVAANSIQQIIPCVSANQDRFMEAIRASQQHRKLFGGGAVWTFYWIKLGEIDGSDRDFFYDRLADGQGLMLGDPIYALRQAMLNARANHRSASRSWMGAMLVKAWNRYRNHERIQVLSFSATENYPEPV